jgi:hypothetical protein
VGCSLAAELAIVLTGGIQIEGANHFALLPGLRRVLDPGYLPGDFGIELRLHHHGFFVWVAAPMGARPRRPNRQPM